MRTSGTAVTHIRNQFRLDHKRNWFRLQACRGESRHRPPTREVAQCDRGPRARQVSSHRWGLGAAGLAHPRTPWSLTMAKAAHAALTGQPGTRSRACSFRRRRLELGGSAVVETAVQPACAVPARDPLEDRRMRCRPTGSGARSRINSRLKVAKKESTRALSQHWPVRPTDRLMPDAPLRAAESRLVVDSGGRSERSTARTGGGCGGPCADGRRSPNSPRAGARRRSR